MHTLQQLKSGALSGVTRLQLSDKLTTFPAEIFALADTLEVLDLSNNCLSSLPDDLHRLHELKILFLSNNQFTQVPAALAACPKLEMIGFKANQITRLGEDVLPLQTRWLILTDNQLASLPDSMGKLHRLQKLALAGNGLTELPSSMAACHSLELARLSANQFTALPDWLFGLPKLSWLAFAGNPLSDDTCDSVKHDADTRDAVNCNPVNSDSVTSEAANHAEAYLPGVPKVSMADISLANKLGEGASGVIYQGRWTCQPIGLQGTDLDIAVKVFKGEVTSDGYPRDELMTCLHAGDHPNLIKVVAQIAEQDNLALVMELIPSSFTNLGLPPSLVTCTRDTFATGTEFSLVNIAKIGVQMADALNHLHSQGVSHGDVYCHNIMTNSDSNVLFGDFGAATHLLPLPLLQREAMAAIEVRALGCLLDDLLTQSSVTASDAADLDEELAECDQMLYPLLNDITQRCLHASAALRPSFAEIKQVLAVLVQADESVAFC